jgi:hypothetical protein
MLSRPCTSACALRIPALLLALTAGVVPARAQRVPVALGLPAEPGYVSLSGALTFGFTQHRITAAFYRERDGADEELGSDVRLARGDLLSFHVQVSEPTYVYVINEDERGESYLLFPLPGQSLSNPLPPGQSHRLPGKDRRQEPLSWEVSSRGGREHFLLVASRERSAGFEKVISTLPPPVLNRPRLSAPLSPDALSTLRSVGGLAVSSVAASGTSLQLHRQPEFSMAFVPGEQTVNGTWVRQATFDNPIRAREASPQRQK